MKPDIQKYRRYVDHFDLSEEQKTDLIKTVYKMMQNFVDRAFGIDSAQQNTAFTARKDVKSDLEMIEYSQQSETAKPLSETFKTKR